MKNITCKLCQTASPHHCDHCEKELGDECSPRCPGYNSPNYTTDAAVYNRKNGSQVVTGLHLNNPTAIYHPSFELLSTSIVINFVFHQPTSDDRTVALAAEVMQAVRDMELPLIIGFNCTFPYREEGKRYAFQLISTKGA